MRKETPFTPVERPRDGVFYSVGDRIGEAVVVYNGNENSFSDYGVINGNKYYYAIFAYLQNGENIKYTTVPAYVNGHVFHLQTDEISATRYPGSKLAWSSDGKLHMVYETNGKIYYTFSEDTGKTWAREDAISGTSDSIISMNPNIIVDNNDNIICMWQVKDHILWRIKKNGEESWGKIGFFTDAAKGFLLKNGNQRTVYAFIFFSISHSPKLATADTFQIFVYKLESDSWEFVDTIPQIKLITNDIRWNTFDYDAVLSHGDSIIAIAFTRGDTLFYAKGTLTLAGTWNWSIEQIGTEFTFSLCITEYESNFHAFLSRNGEIWDINLDTGAQLRLSSNASSISPAAPDSNVVLWMAGDGLHKICVSYRDGLGWTKEVVITQSNENALYPNAIRIPFSPQIAYIYTEGDGAPYNIKVDILNENFFIREARAILQEDNSVRLEWKCNVPPTTEFEIQRKKAGSGWVSIYTGTCSFSAGTCSFSDGLFSYVDNPSLFTDYLYRVRVISDAVNGLWSEEVSLLMVPYLRVTCSNSTAFNNTGKLVRDDLGRLYYVQMQANGFFLSIMYSNTHGETWDILKTIVCEHLAREPSIGIVKYNDTEHLVITYVDSNNALRYYRYHPLTQDTGKIIVPGNVITYSMSTSGGYIYVVWQGADSTLFGKRFKYNDINDTTTWFIGYGVSPSIYAGSSGEIVIAWQEGNEIKVRKILNGNLQPIYLAGTGKFPSVVVSDEHIKVVYQDAGNIVYREAIGTEWSDPKILDQGVTDDAYPQITLTSTFSAITWVKDGSAYVMFVPPYSLHQVGFLYNPKYPQIVAWCKNDSAYAGIFYSTDSSYVPFRRVGIIGNFVVPENKLLGYSSAPDSFHVILNNFVSNQFIDLPLLIPERGIIRVNIYDVTGRRITNVNEMFSPGLYKYKIPLDIQEGVYFIEIEYKNKRKTEKIVKIE